MDPVFQIGIDTEDIVSLKLFTTEENKNYKNKLGRTPLMISIIKQDLELTKYLITLKPDLEEVCNDGYTALMYSVGQKSSEYVNLLVSTGCMLNTYNKKKDLELLDYCLNLNIPNIIQSAENKLKNKTITSVKCRNCNEMFNPINISSNDFICHICTDKDLQGFFNATKISISSEELAKINKKKNRNNSSSSPLPSISPIQCSSSPTPPENFVDISGVLVQPKKPVESYSFFRCPGCNENRKMTKDNCYTCNRKSPLNR